jgi:hypothetical protein
MSTVREILDGDRRERARVETQMVQVKETRTRTASTAPSRRTSKQTLPTSCGSLSLGKLERKQAEPGQWIGKGKAKVESCETDLANAKKSGWTLDMDTRCYREWKRNNVFR